MAAPYRPDLSAKPATPGGSAWPVLARLPRLAGIEPAPLPAFEQREIEGLAIVSDAPPLPSPITETRESIVAQPAAQRQFVDRAHDSAKPAVIITPYRDRKLAAPPTMPPLPSVNPAERSAGISQQRIDRALRRATQPTAGALRPRDLPAELAETVRPPVRRPSRLGSALATQAFTAHSTLAPYASLIVTTALVAAAGLLYWMLLGPVSAPPGVSSVHPRERERPQARPANSQLRAAEAVTGQIVPVPTFHDLAVLDPESSAESNPTPPASLDLGTAVAVDEIAPQQEAGPKPIPALKVVVTPDAAVDMTTAATGSPAVAPPADDARPAPYPSTGRAPLDVTQIIPTAGDDAIEVARKIDDGTSMPR